MAAQAKLKLYPIHFPTVKPGENLGKVVLTCLRGERLALQNGDILAVASKIVSTCENRVAKLSEIHVSRRALTVAERWKMDPQLTALVLKEADRVLGGVRGFLLTVKDGMLTPNAGVDVKNSPWGSATLWPDDPDRSARQLRRSLERHYRKRLGVEIVDSHVTALRLGTVGLAIGISGFVPVVDRRGTLDIFGRTIRVTQANLADGIASSAHLLMGEADERVGAVLVRGAVFRYSSRSLGKFAKLSPKKCLIGSRLPVPTS